jgi:hypothetical protein
MLLKLNAIVHLGSNNGDESGNMITYEIKNEDIKSKSDNGDAAADRMATNR